MSNKRSSSGLPYLVNPCKIRPPTAIRQSPQFQSIQVDRNYRRPWAEPPVRSPSSRAGSGLNQRRSRQSIGPLAATYIPADRNIPRPKTPLATSKQPPTKDVGTQMEFHTSEDTGAQTEAVQILDGIPDNLLDCNIDSDVPQSPLTPARPVQTPWGTSSSSDDYQTRRAERRSRTRDTVEQIHRELRQLSRVVGELHRESRLTLDDLVGPNGWLQVVRPGGQSLDAVEEEELSPVLSEEDVMSSPEMEYRIPSPPTCPRPPTRRRYPPF